ncbi:MAG: histidine phosphatase family protein [Phaeodactylibacter sp.]|nr:histidine phosphatase family protein [Phaeodactylibacter sp.]MCB9304087.1 histidine phosphatase family protein [Lewinellaceae bacterium]
MKTVYFVRHAKSSWDNPTLRDIDRPLSKRGLRDAPFMANLIKGKGLKPGLLLSSPAVRAYSTAKFFADALDIPVSQIEQVKKIYEAYPDDILEIIQELPDDYDTAFLFGHNPTLTSVANMFTDDYIANIPTCAVFRVDSEVENWMDFREGKGKLTELHFPKQFFD